MNKDNLVVMKKEDKVFLYNKQFGNSIRISSEVYDIIKDANSIADVEEIAKEYPEDADYFNALRDSLKEMKILDEIESDGIRKVTYAVTDLCNLSCTHCCYSANLLKKGMENKADLDVLKKIIEINPDEINLTGGEPLSVSNFQEVIDVLTKTYKGEVTLATNATLINESNVERLCSVFSQFDISLDGVDEETTDAIRGQGSFKRVIKSVKLLRKNTNKNIVLSMAVDNITQKNEERFKEMCKELGVEPLIRTMNLVGRAKQNHIDSDEIVQFMRGSSANILGCYDCGGGVDEIFVDAKGDIYPCSNFAEKRFLIANIKEEGWEKKLGWNRNENWFKEFSEYIPDTREECQNCEVKTFCWSCPSLAKSFIETNNIKSMADVCAQKKQGILEAIWND